MRQLQESNIPHRGEIYIILNFRIVLFQENKKRRERSHQNLPTPFGRRERIQQKIGNKIDSLECKPVTAKHMYLPLAPSRHKAVCIADCWKLL